MRAYWVNIKFAIRLDIPTSRSILAKYVNCDPPGYRDLASSPAISDHAIHDPYRVGWFFVLVLGFRVYHVMCDIR